MGSASGSTTSVIETHEVERDDYAENNPNRCFFCKDELYTYLSAYAKEEGYEHITNGTNTDDLGDFRPGLNAAKQYGVRSPMVEAELSKAEIRTLSRGHGPANLGQAGAGLPVLSDSIRYTCDGGGADSHRTG